MSFLPGLKNSIKFDGTTLKFYDGEHDSATFGTAVVSCFQKGGELVMPKYKKLNDAVAEVVNALVNNNRTTTMDIYPFLFFKGKRVDWRR